MSRITRLRARRPLNCRAVARVVQAYVDGETDEVTTRRVARHLDDCLRCGLEYETYAAIKSSIADRGTPIDPETADRLRAFGEDLLRGPPGEYPAPG